MKVRTGCDLVEIRRFKDIDEASLKRIFHPTERKRRKPETLAGMFAAKESCKKIFNELTWHDIEVGKQKNGKPTLLLNTDQKFVDYDVSISHDGAYAMAQVVFLIDHDE